MSETSEQQLRRLVDSRKKCFLDEIRQIPKSKRKFYFDLTERVFQELTIEKSLGIIEL